MEVNKKRQNEEKVLRLMIQVYCRGNHGIHKKQGLCEECRQLADYAVLRTQKCPFMETKTFCSACKVHCYAPAMQGKIRQVMKYSGPRMMLYHPVTAIRHVFVTLSAKRKEKRGRS